VAVSSALAVLSISVGLVAVSTSTVAVGFEFAGDVLTSAVVLIGLGVASRPPDANHPYGHGRVETVAGLLVGFVLMTAAAGIAYRAINAIGGSHVPPGLAAAWVLVLGILVRGFMSTWKFRLGRRIGSTSLVADAWNDAVDILSAGVALGAVLLARLDPARLVTADHYGGVFVGAVVFVTGVRVVRRASLELADTMPDAALTAELASVAMSVPGVLGVEKRLARKTGLRYHVDLHLEVDPDMTVRTSHEIAHEVKRRVQAELAWVADVLVHVEPAPAERQRQDQAPRG
jgi:cation diffusion facilitator family transporter